jgi:hypothetical protein
VAVPGPDPPRVGRLEHVEDKAAFVELVGAIIEATEEDAMPDELPKKKLLDPGRAVLWDAHRGEPIGWRKLGEPIIAEEWSPDGSVILTDVLTPARAVELYGPVTAITIGPGGGWRSVTYGARRRSPHGGWTRVVLRTPRACVSWWTTPTASGHAPNVVRHRVSLVRGQEVASTRSAASGHSMSACSTTMMRYGGKSNV